MICKGGDSRISINSVLSRLGRRSLFLHALLILHMALLKPLGLFLVPLLHLLLTTVSL
jgi:hypothetical protein